MADGQGHINAMLHFANGLHFMVFHIILVNTEFNHRRILRKAGPASLAGLPDFRFATILYGLPSPDDDIDSSQGLVAVVGSIKRHGVRELMEGQKGKGDEEESIGMEGESIKGSFTW